MARNTSGSFNFPRGDVLAFQGEPLELAVWLFVLSAALEHATFFEGPAGRVTLPAGTAIVGIAEMAKFYGCSKSTVSKMLDRLHTANRIGLERRTVGCTVTIRNWERFSNVAPNPERDRERFEDQSAKRIKTKKNTKTKEDSLALDSSLSFELENTTQCASETAAPAALPQLAQIWNANRGQILPKVLAAKGTRLKHAALRWRERPDAAYWVTIVKRVAGSAFCTGKGKTAWVADFDWFVRAGTDVKILEGKYDDRDPNRTSPGRTRTLADLEAEEAAERARRGLT